MPFIHPSSINGEGTTSSHLASLQSRWQKPTLGESANIPSTNGHCDAMNNSGDYSADGHGANGVAPLRASSEGEVPIAICGMAVRLSGGIRTPKQLWDFLLAGKDGRARVPVSRYNIAAFHDASGKATTVPTEYGYFLDEDLGALDTSFFSMARMEVEQASPEQRLMLEVAMESFEDAGETAWRGKSMGCYMGSFGEDWCEMMARETQAWGQYRVSGPGDFVLSNRISYELGLRGPSVTIRTACSASLTALNEACLALSRGDCQSALVGGTNLIMTPGMTTALADQGVLAKDGSCKTFSADADGYARGEAITAIYIKRLDDAVRNGNPVRAVIRGSAINSDGKTPGITHPSSDAHEILMRRAYEVAGITDYSQTGFVECHGTGTPTGDPVEAEAVARVFGASGVYIGSVKPNLGHTEGASGLVSVIKCVLALENSTIPPNIKMGRPNPAIPFERAKLAVPLKPTPWPSDRHERVSINSFGAGGANAHVIIDSAASFNASPASSVAPSLMGTVPAKLELLLFSANSQQSLTKIVENYGEFIERYPEKVADVAYTLANRREHLPHRAFAVANGGSMLAPSPTVKPGQPPSVVMVFTGQGAQWPQMGRDLMHSDPTFRATIKSLDECLQKAAVPPPEWKIESELRKPAKKSRLHTAELAQPLCTAVQIALVETLGSLGVRPHAVVGHSSGEIGASYAAGALTAEEAITAAFYRGVVAERSSRVGAMAAVGMSWEETAGYLVDGVNVACDNSPKSVTISGDAEKVDLVLEDIKKSQQDVMAKRLQVDKAYHSHHMIELGDAYFKCISEKVTGRTPDIPFFSSVSGTLLEEGAVTDARYWQKNLESPVLFRAAVSEITRHSVGKNAVFLEIGPHSALAAPLRQIFSQASKTAHYVSAMIRNRNSCESFLSAIGSLYNLHVPIDYKALAPNGTALPDLPRYPWHHAESFWVEPRLSREHRLRQYPHHDLLGARVPESSGFEPAWRNLLHLHLNTASWIRDHRVGDDVVFPMAGYLAMAGEAVRQVSGTDEAFRVRRVVVSTALVVTEGKPTELITTLRRQRLTDTLDGRWWEFTIVSHDGLAWKKHCTGLVTAQASRFGSGTPPPALPRKIPARALFEAGRLGGLNLGPAFRNTRAISGDTRAPRTVATLAGGRPPDAGRYHLHPGVIDGILQLVVYTQVHGYTRAHQTWLPVGVEQFDIARCAEDFEVDSWVRLENGHIPVGEARCVRGGEVVAWLSGLKLAVNHDVGAGTGEGDAHAAARLEWAPDVDFLDPMELVRASGCHMQDAVALEELGELCVARAQKSAARSAVPSAHLAKFKRWIDARPSSLDPSAAQGDDDEVLLSKIADKARSIGEGPSAGIAAALMAATQEIASLFSDDEAAPDTDLPGQSVSELYDFEGSFDISLFLQHLSHCRPNLRVLELDGGSRSPSQDILSALTLPDGRALYSKYTFASDGFISATERETPFPNLDYAVLNLHDDRLPRGFDAQTYDLVVARNALHGADSLRKGLPHLKTLLHPSGHLLLQDLCPTAAWPTLVLGTRPRFWAGAPESSAPEPYTDDPTLQRQLAAAGFGPATPLPDADAPHQLSRLVVARPAPTPAPAAPKRVALLSPDDDAAAAAALLAPLRAALQRLGYAVSACTLQDPPPPGADVLVALDLAATPFLAAPSAADFGALRTLLAGLAGAGAGALWLLPPAQVGPRDPRAAATLGLARVLRNEMLLDLATCEVDGVGGGAGADAVARVFAKFDGRERGGGEGMRAEMEYVVRGGEVLVGRYYPFALRDELVESDPGDRAILDIDMPGRLTTLKWASEKVEGALAPGEVELEIYVAGINFRDVLVGLNIVDVPPRILGLEASGVVKRVGAGVEHVRPGDRAAAIGHNLITTSAVLAGAGVVRIPDSLSFEEAGAMFFPYMTAMYSLMEVGKLESGQSVLIHSACGGVGLAAVQLSQMLGAEVYVTVGNEEKVQFLVEHHGIPRNRIFSSRDTSFAEGIARETNGEGVDLVLNSVAGELLHATWRCVAPFGKLVELGKRDLIGNGKLDMDVFLANRTYSCVDVGSFPITRPKMLSKHMSTLMDLINRGKISPLRPVSVFDAASPYEAFRYMQPGTHIGRIAIAMRKSADEPFSAVVSGRPKTSKLDGSATYLLVGGLGGLGRAIATWMVENGARHLTFLSRSAGLGPDDESFVGELNSMACQVQLVRGSVTDSEDVQRVIREAKMPVKGILQMSMILRDENFLKMTFDDWVTATAPKIQGTWNLHNAAISAGLELDFFVLFSSLSGIIGQPGQANYASANTFLDAFVQYRNGLGLPASAVDIGAVDGIGYISNDPGLLSKMGGAGFKAIREKELLDALTVAMEPRSAARSAPSGARHADANTFVIGLGSSVPLNCPGNRAVWKRDRRMAIYHNSSTATSADSTSSSSTLRSYIDGAKADSSVLQAPEAAAFFAVEIGKKLFQLLLKPEEDLNTALSLGDLGMDSLVGIELRSWWRQVFGFDVSVMEMLGMATLEALGKFAADGMLREVLGKSETAGVNGA